MVYLLLFSLNFFFTHHNLQTQQQNKNKLLKMYYSKFKLEALDIELYFEDLLSLLTLELKLLLFSLSSSFSSLFSSSSAFKRVLIFSFLIRIISLIS